MNSLSTTKKLALIYIPIIIVILAAVFFILFRNFSQSPTGTNSQVSPTSFISQATQQPFHVISTYPQNNSANIPSGEITMIITTDVPVTSRNSFSFSINPPLQTPGNIQFTNQFPTTKLDAQVYGGFTPTTTYTCTLKDSTGNTIYSWQFQTANKPNQSSTGLEHQRQNQLNQNYYPLIQYTPYLTNDFKLYYSGHLQLEVDILDNAEITTIEQTVDSWIQSKGVDPATHTIKYFDNNGNQIASQPATK